MNITKNTFTSGVSTDIDEQQLEPTYYTDAHNVELVGDGKFFALKNIKGTTSVQSVINTANTHVLGVFSNTYLIEEVEKKCLTIITATDSVSGKYKIYCYDTEGDDLYELYEEDTPTDYFDEERVIDAKSYPENGVDVLYFTDNYFGVRQLRCVITTANIAAQPFLNALDLELQRYGANGTITSTVATGGSLISGSYQFAYRLVDPDRKRFTKWSSLTNAVHVYSEIPFLYTSPTRYYSGIGLYTDKKITVDVALPSLELDFTHYQLAVVENIYPSDITTNVSLLPITEIGLGISHEYTANQKIGTIPIEDIVVDFAAIETAKTLSVQNNRLFLGNIKYKNLELDTAPSVTAATVLREVNLATGDGKKGYFRDEVYRFAVVYRDEYGNKSAPYILDFTGTDVEATGAVDAKFPSRSDSSDYSIINTISAVAGPVGLGLQITLQDHPTWAKSLEIVRVPRIKRILSQTPVIPYTTVKGIGAFNEYPTIHYDGTAEVTVESAQPMTSDEIYVPKNLLWPEMRKISAVTSQITVGGVNRRYLGEAKLDRQTTYTICGIFPQESQYNNKEFALTGAETLETVDFVNLKISYNNFTESAYNAHGNSAYTNISCTLSALSDGQYYYHSAHSGKPAISTSVPIVEAGYMDNLSDGIIIGGVNVNKYSELATSGLTIGTQPNVLRGTVIKLNEELIDEGHTSIPFAVGNHFGYSATGEITEGTNVRYESSLTNNFISNYSNFIANSTPAQVLRIANIVKPSIGNTRYGSTDTEQEFISTGCVHTFSGAPASVTLDIWGGDCIVSNHTFKVCDSTYSVVNQEKNNGTALATNTLAEQWGKLFTYNTSDPDPVIMMPFALKGVSQFVQVYLESEYNGEATDADILSPVGSGTQYSTSVTAPSQSPSFTATGVAVSWNNGGDMSSNTYSPGINGYLDIDVTINISLSISWGMGATSLNCGIYKNGSLIAAGTPISNPDASGSISISVSSLAVIDTDTFTVRIYSSAGAATTATIATTSTFEATAQVTDATTSIMGNINKSNNRSPLTYNYNINLNKQNDQRVYFSLPTTTFTNYNYGARIHYSDIKLYNTSEQGFDLFRVANFYDMEESGGDITKLALAADNMFAIQTKRTSYLPIGERVLETSDAGIIAVGTANVINQPRVLDQRGCQNIAAVVETGQVIFFPDNFNKAVYSVEGQQLVPISDKRNASYFREKFGTIIDIKSVHDPVRKEYWIYGTDFCRIYNYALGVWVGNYEFTNLLGGCYTNQKLYLLGKVTNQISVYEMYTGNYSQLFSTTVTPRVTFVVNPDGDFAKTFDNLMLVATERLNDVDAIVHRESALGNQTVSNMSLDAQSREGNFRIKTLRDADNSRLRGLRMQTTVNWKTDNVGSALSSVYTRYRLSSRTPI